MEYRALGQTGLEVSEVGLGCEHLEGLPTDQVIPVVREALDLGVNILDVFMSEPNVRTSIGRALAGRREQAILQGHIGAAWRNGQYARTRDRKESQTFVEDFLQRLDVEYIDIGMIHFVDSEEDYAAVFETDLLDYIVSLRDKGVVRCIGMSSHNPVIAEKAAAAGFLDVLMLSLNPAFDLLPSDVPLEDQFTHRPFAQQQFGGMDPARTRLYHTCQREQVGITVMKALGAGRLLDADLSPLGTALSTHQCVQYALDRPAVASVLVGCRTVEEVRQAAAYHDTSLAERDYSSTLSKTQLYANRGRCMYCNHCLPCPSRINIAEVMRYLDLAEAATHGNIPATVREHYRNLAHSADDCTACGQCETRCPFAVPVMQRMEQAQGVFK